MKPPEISALPLRRPLTSGSETTSPSRTIANRFCGDCCLVSSPVVLANFLAPLSLKSSCTIQPEALWLSKTDEASSTSVPSTSEGPRTNLESPSGYRSNGLGRLAVGRLAAAAAPPVGAVQRRELLGQLLLIGPAGLAGGVRGLARLAAPGGLDGVGVGAALSAFRAPGTARPWVVEVGVGDEPLGFSPPLWPPLSVLP